MFLLPCIFTCLNWGLNASQKLFMGREFCLPYCAYLYQKLKHSSKRKAETHTETSVSKENSIKTNSGGIVGKSNQQWLSEGTATCSQLHEPLFPLVNQSSYISCPAASFTQSLLFSLTSLQLCPAFPPCLWGALVSVTHVCVLCVHLSVVAPGITDPSGGRWGVGPGFLVWLCTVGSKLCK